MVFPPVEINSPSSGQTESSADPISLAKQIGFEALGEHGAKIFESYEISYLSRWLHRFSGSDLRMLHHVFVYGTKGAYKNVSVNMFFKYCVPENVKFTKLSNTSIESCEGSVTENRKLHPPTFYDYDFAIIPELLAFLETHKLRRQLGVMNDILETEETEKDLIKFSDPPLDIFEDYPGLEFDGRKLKYRPYTVFYICSHVLDDYIMKILEDNAFIDRLRTINYKLTDKQLEALLQQPLKIFNEDKMAELKRLNEKYKTILQNTIPTPYHSEIDVLNSEALKLGKKIANEYKVDLEKVYNVRAQGNLMREVTIRRLVGFQGEINVKDFMLYPRDLPTELPRDVKTLHRERTEKAVSVFLEFMGDGELHKAEDIVEALQPYASKPTAYSIMKQYAESPEFALWRLKSGDNNR